MFLVYVENSICLFKLDIKLSVSVWPRLFGVVHLLTCNASAERNMVRELIKAAVTGKSEDYNTQFPVQEYIVDLNGVPTTPDVGGVIGENVQNRLSTAADDEDQPAVPEPSVCEKQFN